MFTYLCKIRNKKGFTLTEVIIVISIVAVLSAVAVPSMIAYQRRADAQRQNDTQELFISLYKIHF